MASGIKTGGRKEGTPNKVTQELRAKIKEIVCIELESLESKMELLQPKDRVDVLIKLLQYVLPKPTDEVEVKANDINVVEIIRAFTQQDKTAN